MIRYGFRATPEHGETPPTQAGVGTQAENGAGFRGGNWNNTAVYARASDRNNAANVNANRNNNNGWRAVRPAPSGAGWGDALRPNNKKRRAEPL